jgi:hypothetical protein
MRSNGGIILQVHTHTSSVVAIKRFENDWIAYLAGGSNGALLVLYTDRLGNG